MSFTIISHHTLSMKTHVIVLNYCYWGLYMSSSISSLIYLILSISILNNLCKDHLISMPYSFVQVYMPWLSQNFSKLLVPVFALGAFLSLLNHCTLCLEYGDAGYTLFYPTDPMEIVWSARRQETLKGQSNEIFYLQFFHRWTAPKPLTRYLKTFRI